MATNLCIDTRIVYLYNIYMRRKRIRTKLFHVWLHEKELEYMNNYAEENLMSASELIRHWIHQSMKREGLLKDVSINTKIKKGRK